MDNIVYIEAYTTAQSYNESQALEMPFESFLTYSIYKYCAPTEVTVSIVSTDKSQENSNTAIFLYETGLQFVEPGKLPWQVSFCVCPVVIFNDTVITGLCAVARHICRYKTLPSVPQEHEEGLLGFNKSCLQAPNEASIFTKFCEVDIIKTVKEILATTQISQVPTHLVRFENHMKKPVRVHNISKITRDLKTADMKTKNINGTETDEEQKKELAIDCSIKIEDLQIKHQYVEGPFFTLADLILIVSYHVIAKKFGSAFESLLPVTNIWYRNVIMIPEIQSLMQLIKIEEKLNLENDFIPATENVSLYKCDPKTHSPEKRLFTKEDIENALSSLLGGMELDISINEYESTIDWNEIPDGANPHAHLPAHRVSKKAQQFESLTLAVLSIAKEGDLIVDFCSGGGHLGILIAYLLPKCTVILLENNEQSLLRARERVHQMGLKNVYFFQCNLDFFVGKFDIGIALHAYGIASDLVLDKCLKANAKFVLCPCCYGSLHATDRLVYPRSTKFSGVTVDEYLCLGYAADQTYFPVTMRGSRCMAAIDSDRAHLAEEFGYKVTLTKLKPLTCTPTNNMLIGIPS